MKKVYKINFLLLVFCLIGSVAHAIHLATQAELDAFIADNPNLTAYNGDLIIGANLDISWGEPYGNTDINDLSGLNKLKTVDGLFYLVKFKGNNLSALSNLEEVTGSFVITGAPSLKNLTGLSKMQTVGGEFIVSHNYVMEDISGFSLDVDVALSVVVDSNETMLTLNGYEKIKCEKIVMLCYNPAMTDMSAFQGVSTVDELWIFDNKELEDVSFLSELVEVTGKLTIHNNPKLFTLDGLSNLEQVKSLAIFNNQSLYDCDAEGICKRLAVSLDDVNIHNNKEGCNSTDEINCLVANENVKELAHQIVISPNPTNGLITLKANQDLRIKEISIINYLGQVVRTYENTDETMNLNDLIPGTYFIRLNVDNQMVTKRLIID